MPRTKKQEVIFTLIMALFMVYAMSLYNTVLQSGGFQLTFLGIALIKMLKEYFIAVPVAFFLGSRAAKFLALRLLPQAWRPRLIPYGISFFTVIIMVPLMTTVIYALQIGLSLQILPRLGLSILKNYLFALPLQVFLIGPLVRAIFKRLFPLAAPPAQAHATS